MPFQAFSQSCLATRSLLRYLLCSPCSLALAKPFVVIPNVMRFHLEIKKRGGRSIFLNKFLLFAKVWETCGQALTFCKAGWTITPPRMFCFRAAPSRDRMGQCIVSVSSSYGRMQISNELLENKMIIPGYFACVSNIAAFDTQ